MPTYIPPAPINFRTASDDTDVNAMVTSTNAAIQAVRPNIAGDGSPGALGLIYFDAGRIRHTVSMNLTTLGDPYNYGQMLAEANRLAEGFSHALPATLAVEGFFIRDATGVQIFAGLLSSVWVGDHVSTGSLDSNSYTVTITGRGLGTAPGLFPGNTLTRWFPSTGYDQARGRKFIALNTDIGLVLWAAALGTSTVAWADEHGWKAGIRPTCPIQFNAAVQRKAGV